MPTISTDKKLILQRLKPTRQNFLILILLILPFNLLFFPARRDYLQSLSGWQNPIIDVWFAYSSQVVYAILPEYGPQGRLLYALSEVTLDVAYPILYTSLLGLLQIALFASLLAPTHPLHRLKILPLLVFTLDILENISLAVLLLIYPVRLDSLAWFASLFTSLKWLAGICLLIIVLVAAGAYALHPPQHCASG